ncbi:ribbon-helix-helix domain-containing protein [Staphylococcus hyicus]|uniref:ribbon-helix-helix domain-containing protein n=1 Tax=Staphylococcus hyicus TaxID=1284 RepID=UPI0036D3550B
MENKYGLKNRVRISNAISKENYEFLKKTSEETMIPVSKLLDKSIQLLRKEYE